jgi:hypothetical protein
MRLLAESASDLNIEYDSEPHGSAAYGTTKHHLELRLPRITSFSS